MLGEPWFYTYSYLVSGIACPFVAKSMSKLHTNLTTTHPKFTFLIFLDCAVFHKMFIKFNPQNVSICYPNYDHVKKFAMILASQLV